MNHGLFILQFREGMDIAEKERRENLNNMEDKFFKEKVSSLKGPALFRSCLHGTRQI